MGVKINSVEVYDSTTYENYYHYVDFTSSSGPVTKKTINTFKTKKLSSTVNGIPKPENHSIASIDILQNIVLLIIVSLESVFNLYKLLGDSYKLVKTRDVENFKYEGQPYNDQVFALICKKDEQYVLVGKNYYNTDKAVTMFGFSYS